MGKLIVNGHIPLHGQVSASGAKNAALPILAGVILAEGETELTNVPRLADIVTMTSMLNALGLRAELHAGNRMKIWNTRKVRHLAPYDLVTSMRASFFVAGPILARTGFAKVPLPGGCAIGTRPVDIHLKGFQALGAAISIEHGFVELKAKKLVGTRIRLDFPSVGATENIMMAGTLAEGTTIINNAAQEPEIVDLGNFLISAGATIEGLGTPEITIHGTTKLRGTSHRVIPDRIEAGSLLIAGPITGGDVTVENAVANDLRPLLDKLIEAGVGIEEKPNNVIRAYAKGRFSGVRIETEPFPGFPTDMQAQMMSLLTLANGPSIVAESIFENRFMHANELMRMGANIKIENRYAIIEGVPELSGADVKITDLRAGAALILAGLAAKGSSGIYGLKHLKRGYENLPEKLRQLGADITNEL